MKTPVCMIIFNRPDRTQQIFNVIKQVKPPKLLVVADGARLNKIGEAEKCAETRAIFDQIDWDCELLTNYAESNLGIYQRVTSGLKWVFEIVEEAIILEDDCLPNLSFFQFCEEMLERYRNDERITMISGNNFQLGGNQTGYSYYFSHYGHTWGWASWRRTLQRYSSIIKYKEKLPDVLARIFRDANAISFWGYNIEKSYLAVIASDFFNSTCNWDYLFVFNTWLIDGMAISPSVNLVTNIGFDEEATHCTNPNLWFANLPIEEMQLPLKHPPKIERNISADNFSEKTLASGLATGEWLPLIFERLLRQSEYYLNNNLNEQALNLIEKAIILQPNIPDLHYGKAIALARLGYSSEAVETANELLQMDNSHTLGSSLLNELMSMSNGSNDSKNLKKFNILHLNTYDFGGAAKAAIRIHKNLLENNYPSKMLVLQKKNNENGVISDLLVQPKNEVNLLPYNGKSNPDYYYFDRNISQHRDIFSLLNTINFQPNVIIAHWVSYFLNIKDLYQLQQKTKAPILWFLMDMAPLTGGCHYAWDCEGYMNQCGTCPALYSSDPNDFSSQYLNLKLQYINKMDITIIAGTSWLENQAKKSTLFKNKKIVKIMLGVDPNVFKPQDKELIRKALNLPSDKKIILFGAEYNNEKRKGMKYLIQALAKIKNFKSKSDILLLSIGKSFQEELKTVPLFEYAHVDYIDNRDDILALFYQVADVFVCPSIEDSGPMMINEAIMCGVPVVSFEMGVAIDLVHSGKTGYRAKLKDSDDLAKGIDYILGLSYEEAKKISIQCRELGLRLCSSEAQMKSFEILFSGLFNNEQLQQEDIDRAIQIVQPYTMLTYERLSTLYQQVVSVEQNNVEGCYIECGVWKGGAVALMALANLKYGKNRRHIHLFDSFDDICEPDAKVDGLRAIQDVQKYAPMKAGTSGKLAPIKGIYDSFGGHGTIDGNKKLLESQIGYNPEYLHYHQGWFQETLPRDIATIGKVAILRLDGDWYTSIKICLEFLYDYVVVNGFIIIDDYGYYEGCKKAVDEFRKNRKIVSPLYHIDGNGVFWIKTQNNDNENKLKLLHLGCGDIVHKEWVNVDFKSLHKDVMDKGLPFSDNEFDAVYHSHILEHFLKHEALSFIKECFRVLKKGGIIRIVVSNLEEIAKEYLKWLDAAEQGIEDADLNYDWIMCELFDQVVRNHSGGEMLSFLSQEFLPNKEFISGRIGSEFFDKSDINYSKTKHEQILKQIELLSENDLFYHIGRFRMSGEIHQWMYDKYSLTRLLKQVGFIHIQLKTPFESNIPNFNKYELDTYNGKPRGGSSSLFIEAVKPLDNY